MREIAVNEKYRRGKRGRRGKHLTGKQKYVYQFAFFFIENRLSPI